MISSKKDFIVGLVIDIVYLILFALFAIPVFIILVIAAIWIIIEALVTNANKPKINHV